MVGSVINAAALAVLMHQQAGLNSRCIRKATSPLKQAVRKQDAEYHEAAASDRLLDIIVADRVVPRKAS